MRTVWTIAPRTKTASRARAGTRASQVTHGEVMALGRRASPRPPAPPRLTDRDRADTPGDFASSYAAPGSDAVITECVVLIHLSSNWDETGSRSSQPADLRKFVSSS